MGRLRRGKGPQTGLDRGQRCPANGGDATDTSQVGSPRGLPPAWLPVYLMGLSMRCLHLPVSTHTLFFASHHAGHLVHMLFRKAAGIYPHFANARTGSERLGEWLRWGSGPSTAPRSPPQSQKSGFLCSVVYEKFQGLMAIGWRVQRPRKGQKKLAAFSDLSYTG